MVDYGKGKIYKVWDNGYNMCYIGSTTQPLNKRMNEHKYNYKQYLKNKTKFTTACLLFDEYGTQNCKIELVENYPCKCKEELLSREGHYQRECECVNKIIANRTSEEYRETFRDRLNNYSKEWHSKNKETKLKKEKEYRETHKEEKKEYYKKYMDNAQNKEKRSEYLKEWYEKNRESKLKKNKEYRDTHKGERKEYFKQYYQNKQAKNNMFDENV